MTNSPHISSSAEGNVFPLRPGLGTEDRLPGGGQPPYDGGMEARVAVLEQIARNTEKVLDRMDARLLRIEDEQKADFRILFGALVTVALGLASLIAHGFHWL
jgi:hypothetical protein